jgi:hypothetical protein
MSTGPACSTCVHRSDLPICCWRQGSRIALARLTKKKSEHQKSLECIDIICNMVFCCTRVAYSVVNLHTLRRTADYQVLRRDVPVVLGVQARREAPPIEVEVGKYSDLHTQLRVLKAVVDSGKSKYQGIAGRGAIIHVSFWQCSD